MSKLGIKKKKYKMVYLTEDNSYVFTDTESLRDGALTSFAFTHNDMTFSGDYTGLAAVKIDTKNNIQKLAVTGFSSLQKKR